MAQTPQSFRRMFVGGIVHKATVNPSSLADAAGETIVVTVPGAEVGDIVLVGAGVDLLDVTVTAYVQAADTVEVRIQNESAGTRDITSSTWTFVLLKPTADVLR